MSRDIDNSKRWFLKFQIFNWCYSTSLKLQKTPRGPCLGFLAHGKILGIFYQLAPASRCEMRCHVDIMILWFLQIMIHLVKLDYFTYRCPFCLKYIRGPISLPQLPEMGWHFVWRRYNLTRNSCNWYIYLPTKMVDLYGRYSFPWIPISCFRGTTWFDLPSKNTPFWRTKSEAINFYGKELETMPTKKSLWVYDAISLWRWIF